MGKKTTKVDPKKTPGTIDYEKAQGYLQVLEEAFPGAVVASLEAHEIEERIHAPAKSQEEVPGSSPGRPLQVENFQEAFAKLKDHHHLQEALLEAVLYSLNKHAKLARDVSKALEVACTNYGPLDLTSLGYKVDPQDFDEEAYYSQDYSDYEEESWGFRRPKFTRRLPQDYFAFMEGKAYHEDEEKNALYAIKEALLERFLKPCCGHFEEVYNRWGDPRDTRDYLYYRTKNYSFHQPVDSLAVEKLFTSRVSNLFIPSRPSYFLLPLAYCKEVAALALRPQITYEASQDYEDHIKAYDLLLSTALTDQEEVIAKAGKFLQAKKASLPEAAYGKASVQDFLPSFDHLEVIEDLKTLTLQGTYTWEEVRQGLVPQGKNYFYKLKDKQDNTINAYQAKETFSPLRLLAKKDLEEYLRFYDEMDSIHYETTEESLQEALTDVLTTKLQESFPQYLEAMKEEISEFVFRVMDSMDQAYSLHEEAGYSCYHNTFLEILGYQLPTLSPQEEEYYGGFLTLPLNKFVSNAPPPPPAKKHKATKAKTVRYHVNKERKIKTCNNQHCEATHGHYATVQEAREKVQALKAQAK